MRDRFRALLLHLLLSASLITAVLTAIYCVWYPSPIASAAGLSDLVVVVVVVDIVLGPLLTFVVFNRAKKSLRLDLACIATLQLAVLAYGVYTIGVARPAWIVFNADRFDLVLAHELEARFTGKAAAEYRAASWTGPRWVASVNPIDAEERNSLIFESATGGADLPQRPDLYVPIESQRESLKRHAKQLDELKQFNPAGAVARLRQDWPSADGWLPLMARARPMIVLIRRSDAKVLGIVALMPWSP
ncbi:TfpX/TfpZ family type IV pilin accessory protein [Piscinibacter gummiphilus]|uniref:TfpX/TfpZ family type IV pilin accessory protein n=1 Tax=Piscinibacter gummiphilus TaxID=946333 RepID=A0ABZ0CU63_9BURK|nr:TfpX/TfpZ family type IV pilin accessory protein [Piscinibacter gummiphilus]WOB08527.1 TfpX/TfpZ family type IV pilin accessory protein [Piscinibacter gummiphilus]